MQIAIFGAGYVGLVTGVCLAAVGHELFAVVDLDVGAGCFERLAKRRRQPCQCGLALRGRDTQVTEGFLLQRGYNSLRNETGLFVSQTTTHWHFS